jgi:acyl-CoA synthetase (AMP-forming)/AMP-acid ligase II
METLLDLLRHSAAERPHERAYTFLRDGDDESENLSYAQLEERVRSVATLLQDRGCEGQRVVLLFAPGLEFVAAFFGCLFARAVAVPVYPPDPGRLEFSIERVRSVVADSDPALLLYGPELEPLRESIVRSCPELGKRPWVCIDQAGAFEAGAWKDPGVRPGELAFVQYTSGSTSDPKGVMLSHAALVSNQRVIHDRVRLGPDSVLLSWLPLYHDMGLIGIVMHSLYLGASCYLMSPFDFLRRPARWLHAITRHGATLSGGPNFCYELCVRRIPDEAKEGLDLSSWEVAFNGSEPVRMETLRRFAEAFEPWGFRKEALYPCYGLAESSLMVTGSRKGEGAHALTLDASALARNRIVRAGPGAGRTCEVVCCGDPSDGHSLRIVDPETGRRCDDDEVGEVWASGPSIGEGYWGRPEQSRDVFRATVSDSPDQVFLRTGDLGFLHRGRLYITGRIKEVINLRGRNLYPQDVEAAAQEADRALRAGCGIAFAVSAAGEDWVVLVQEVDPTKTEDPSALLARIREQVMVRQQVQLAAVCLVPPRTVPKTSSGKLKRAACRETFLAGGLEEISAWRRGGLDWAALGSHSS